MINKAYDCLTHENTDIAGFLFDNDILRMIKLGYL